MKGYSTEIETQMCNYYGSLSEKDRRRYAAIESLKLGYGGIQYIRRLFGCDTEAIKRGLGELQDPTALSSSRIRQPGAGRKSIFEQIEGLDEAFLKVLSNHTAGSPMDEQVKWTNLNRHEIASLLDEDEDIQVSVTVVDQLLSKHHYRRRKASKSLATGESHPQRNEQFEKITQLKQEYQSAGQPVLSMDSKKENP